MVNHAIHARIIIFFMFFFLYIFCSSGAFPLPSSLVTASGERIHYVGFTFVFIYDDFLSAPDKSSYSEISHRFAIFIYKSYAEVTHAGTVYDSSMNDVLTTSQCDTL